MKKATLTITYDVPAWNFCNKDYLTGNISKETCRFCKSNKGANTCLLYDSPLSSDGTLIEKTTQCKRATVGLAEQVDLVHTPTVDPALIVKQSILEYTKQYNALLDQGYPRTIAQSVAKQYVLGEK